jgi:adenine-specific DNA-methyltransferase
MAAKRPGKRKIEQYGHADKKRANNPPVGLVTPETDKDGAGKTYAYDQHLDPSLQWAGKTEHTSFEVPTVSLHVHERIDPRIILDAVRKLNGAESMVQGNLFEQMGENPPLRQALDFYKHPHGWSNRLIAGDSLLVMNSLLEKEGLAGKVQMVYIDPPYGIKYGSNFQPFVNKRDVKDRKDEDLTQEPEMIRAFRDTWEVGIHSYLTYLRDRLLLARELLHASGSCFVQISDENVHHARELFDDVFGAENFTSRSPTTSRPGRKRCTISRWWTPGACALPARSPSKRCRPQRCGR